MKIRSFLASMLAVAALASCSNENEGPDVNPGDADVAYLSLHVVTPYGTPTRAPGSSEQPATPDENAVNSLYLVTFDAANKIVNPAASKPYATVVATTPNTMTAPDAIKVSAKTANLLLIANPGDDLFAVLENAYTGMTYADLNQAIALAFTENTSRKPETLVDELRTLTGLKNNASPNYKDFTMINVDDLVSAGTIYTVGSDTEAQAKAKAEQNRITVRVERLTSKIQVGINSGGVTVLPAGAKFTQSSADFWTIDVWNSTFFPYAQKHFLTQTHTPSLGFYDKAFYTVDPNYTGNAGLKYNTLVAPSMAPNVTWMGNNTVDYCIENTMEAPEQRFKNATRIIIKGEYWPADVTQTGDWFRYGNKNYDALSDLHDEFDAFVITIDNYNAIEAGGGTLSAAQLNNKAKIQRFFAACEVFYNNVRTQLLATRGSIPSGAVNFKGLTETDLLAVQNGGEVVKDENGCIRWYQNGLNYYYYEMRHDNTTEVTMDNYKYGVVRNNWYVLTLNSVSGPGTPWYPSINPDPDPAHPEYPDPKPDPKDPDNPTPDPEDPIDQEYGYLGISVNVAPWIYWTNGIDL